MPQNDDLESLWKSENDPQNAQEALEALRACIDQLPSTESQQNDIVLQNIDNDPWIPSLDIPVNGTSNEGFVGTPNIDWLSSALPEPSLLDNTISILTSNDNDDTISNTLLDIFGFDRIEYVQQTLEKRKAIIHEIKLKNKANTKKETVRPLPKAAAASSSNTVIDQEQRGPYHPDSQLTIRNKDTIAAEKKARKAAAKQRMSSKLQEEEDEDEIDLEAWDRANADRMQKYQQKPLFSQDAPEVPDYPNIYTTHTGSGMVSMYMNKYTLTSDAEREDHEFYEEITIPPSKSVPMRPNEKFINISSLDNIAKRSFKGYETLNRLQSIVFPIAYETNENMLICAPTGAGKTDVAMLTILHALSNSIRTIDGQVVAPDSRYFKIVYVAPMKALASEIVRKLGKRLAWLGVVVKELTGDMQLTRAEIAATHIIVTTPEKWDVVTRKSTGEGEVASQVKLLIIDEVHLLHDERGAVIESIVARTLRQVESSQSLIRIVGLSATLPNYVDVATFLRVNPYRGLFYFDSSFRPIPLEQHFVGVKGKAGSPESRKNLDKATYEKACQLIQEGKQVMVFVHARKETVKTAETLRDLFNEDGLSELLLPNDHPQYGFMNKEIAGSRNRELKGLVKHGFGIHNAGMLRSDRHLSERLFEMNITKILVCTATLAWGVNLPAYAVIIKGTQIFDPSKGGFNDLSVLDVLQIFGRAGRPQFEDKGVGYICTTEDKIDHYVSAITQQRPIESNFISGLVDALNAEISLGTVTNVDEGVRWIGWTYLFVRLRCNPMAYGITRTEVEQDPSLGSKRLQLITHAARQLASAKMIFYDEDVGSLLPTELGRIASRFYLKHDSIEIFNELFRPAMTEADFLRVLCSSVEFAQIKVQESENKEISKLVKESTSCEVKGGLDSPSGKVNILLQTYISRGYIDDFALITDTNYISQNAGRIARALFEIAMSKKWAKSAQAALEMCKSIEKRVWPYEHPLKQFSLNDDMLFKVEEYANDWQLYDLADLPVKEAMSLLKTNERSVKFIQTCCRQFPHVKVDARVQPLSVNFIQTRVTVKPLFTWSEKVHGTVETFHIWILNSETNEILAKAQDQLRAKTEKIEKVFTSNLDLHLASQISVHIIWDNWIGADDVIEVDLSQIRIPSEPCPYTDIIPVPNLNLTETGDSQLCQVLKRDSDIDLLQTRVYHSLYHTGANTFVSSPTLQNDLTLLLLPIWRDIRTNGPDGDIIIITAHPERSLGLYKLLNQHLGQWASINHCRNEWSDLILTSQNDATSKRSRKRIIVGHADSIFRSIPTSISPTSKQTLQNISLIIFDDVHALDLPMELSIAMLRSIFKTQDTRFIGYSAPLTNSDSFASSIGVDEQHLYFFQPNATTTMPNYHVKLQIEGFDSGYSVRLMKRMTRSAFGLMRSSMGGTICFVSKGACKSVSRELVTLSAAESEFGQGVFVDGAQYDLVREIAISLWGTDGSRGTVSAEEEEVESLQHGIGMIMNSAHGPKSEALMQLFKSGAIKVLVMARELAWDVPYDLFTQQVIVLGTQYAVIDDVSGDRRLREYPIKDLVQMQRVAALRSRTREYYYEDYNEDNDVYMDRDELDRNFVIMCQEDQEDEYRKTFEEGILTESSLLADHESSSDARHWLLNRILQDIDRPKDRSFGLDGKNKLIGQLLQETYLYQRLISNPSYYLPMLFSTGEEGTDKDDEDYQEKMQNVNETMLLNELIDVSLNDGRDLCLCRRKSGKNSGPWEVTKFGLLAIHEWISKKQSRFVRKSNERNINITSNQTLIDWVKNIFYHFKNDTKDASASALKSLDKLNKFIKNDGVFKSFDFKHVGGGRDQGQIGKSLLQFYGRLPRILRDYISENGNIDISKACSGSTQTQAENQDKVEQEDEEDVFNNLMCRILIMAIIVFGRIPVHDNSLENIQAHLLVHLMKQI